MGTPLGSVGWVPAAAVELGTLYHLSSWFPGLGRGQALLTAPPHTQGTAQALAAPSRMLGQRQGVVERASGFQNAWVPESWVSPHSVRAAWVVPGLELRRWGQIKASFPSGLFVLRFFKVVGVGPRREGPLCSQSHSITSGRQSYDALLPRLTSDLGGAKEGVPLPLVLCSTRPGAPQLPLARCRPAWHPANDR